MKNITYLLIISLCALFLTSCKHTIIGDEKVEEMDKEHVRAMNCKRMKAALTLEIQNDIRFNQSNEDLADALQDTKRVYNLCLNSDEPYYYEIYKEIFYDPYNRIDYLKSIEDEIEERETK